MTISFTLLPGLLFFIAAVIYFLLFLEVIAGKWATLAISLALLAVAIWLGFGG